MQLMWLSGPTGNVKTISITTRTVLTASVVVGLFLVASGFLLHFVGFKIAVEYNPDLARSIGGVTTEAEQKRMESIYRDHLAQLRESMQNTINEVRQLETMKNRFMEMATPNAVREKLNRRDDNKGGPLIAPKPFSSLFRQPLGIEFDQTLQDFVQTQTAVAEMHGHWEKQLNWLHALPTGLPVKGDFRLSSGFGIRNDPFTGNLAMHEGLDFVAPVGTPVMATAPGQVIRSERDLSYGHVVDILHSDGFMTRYAHLSVRMVKEGDMVERQQVIGQVGSTGRSTGPHLHYEIHRRDRALNPTLMLSRTGG